MSNLLVHLHLFYFDQADYFIEKLKNIDGCSWDLYVSVIKHEEEVEQRIKDAFPFAKIILVENRGFDIWPFIQIIKNIDLDKYDYILKLHTKSYYDKAVRVNKFWYKHYEWRNILVDCLLENKKQFLHLLKIFKKKPKTGMLCSRLFYMPLSDFLPEDTSALLTETNRIGISLKTNYFLTGTMFMTRSGIFKKLQRENIDAGMFPLNPNSHSFGSMAHIYERILSIIVYDEGYTIETLSSNKMKELYLSVVKETFEPALEKLFSLNRRGEEQIKTLTLFGFDIPLEKSSSKKHT